MADGGPSKAVRGLLTGYTRHLKELRYGLRIWKNLSLKVFQVCRLQSVLIFSILDYPCSFMVYDYLFGVFLS